MESGRPQVLAGGPHQVRRYRPHHPGSWVGIPLTRRSAIPNIIALTRTAAVADYAMFGTPDVQAIGNNAVPPDIIIESKPLWAELDGAVPQLRRYAQASPRMQSRRGGPDQRESVVDLRPLPPGFLHQQAGRAGGYHHRRPSGRCPDPAPVAGTYQVSVDPPAFPRVVSGVRTAQVLHLVAAAGRFHRFKALRVGLRFPEKKVPTGPLSICS